MGKEKNKIDLNTKIAKMSFKSPIWVASGTFGSGKEYKDFIDLKTIGAIIPKTITLHAREGNPCPRVVETPAGMLNAIGLENKGIDGFLQNDAKELNKTGTKIIISIAGSSDKEYEKCIKKLEKSFKPYAIELNLSCPNVSHKGSKYKLFAQDPKVTAKIIKRIKSITTTPVIAKLTPNVTDIKEIAEAAYISGADAVSLVNTYMGMAVDAGTMKPVLGNISGGLSGPAIKPLALKAVWEVYNAVKIPVIGIGGIMTGIDVAEFMLCGARSVQIGTVNFVDPEAHKRITKEFTEYLKRKKIKKATDIVGKLKI